MTFQKFRTISSSDLSFARGRKIALSRISKFHPKQLIKVARNFLLACRDRDYFYMFRCSKSRFHTLRSSVSPRSSRTIHALRDSIIRLCTHGLIVHARMYTRFSYVSLTNPRIIYKLPPFATSSLIQEILKS